MTNDKTKQTADKGKDKAPVSPPRRIESTDLFQGSSRIIIAHDGVEYTLLVTRNGKLILNK